MQESLSESMYFSLETILGQSLRVEIFRKGYYKVAGNMAATYQLADYHAPSMYLPYIFHVLCTLLIGIFFLMLDCVAKSGSAKTITYNKVST